MRLTFTTGCYLFVQSAVDCFYSSGSTQNTKSGRPLFAGVGSLRTVVVSDVHLGYTDSDKSAFTQFLDSLLAGKPDKLVLLGDIFDFWRRSDVDVLMENQDIIEKLLQLPLIYVYGNHDYSMLKLSHRFPQSPGIEVVPHITLNNQHSRFFLYHGYDLEVFTSMETVGLEAYEAFSEAMCHAGDLGGTVASWIWVIVELVKGKLTGPARALLDQAANKPAEARQTLEKVDILAKSAASNTDWTQGGRHTNFRSHSSSFH